MNRVQFSVELADVFGFDKKLIHEVNTSELKQAADRPKKGGLKVNKLNLETGIKIRDIREGLRAMKSKMDEEKK
jgi:dTDP-4-dehydrorhamnose reductase